MVSPSIEKLHDTIRRVRRRRNLILHTRQIGWCLVSIVGLFIILVFLEMIFHPAMPARLLLFCLLGAATGAVGWQTVRTFKRLSRDDKRLAHYVDDRIPDLEQRLITSMDSYGRQQGAQSPSGLVEALWQDTAAHLRNRNVEQVTTSRPAWVASGTAMVLICLLSVALWDSDRFSGAARRIIWPWSIPAGGMSLSAGFEVAPGDILIRRGSDVTVSAKIEHASSGNVFLFLREPAGDWKRIRMQAEDAPPEYMHYISGVQTDLTYYVDTGTKRSGQYRIRVFDLTRIESIDVDYAYPAHTGLENKTEKNGGDIIAPEGTRVRLHITFNRPVQKGVLKFDDGSTGDLTPAHNAATASFVVARDGTYAVDAVDDAGRKVENPLEYIIRAIADAPPEIFFSMPGRDIRVMALEEVSIAASAKDDFGLTKFDLNYSVAGNAAQQVSFLETTQSPGPPAVDGKSIIYLEDLQVAPGDFVTYYLTAADNNGIGGPSEIISDIYFLEVIRTDQAFRRAAGQSGGGGGQSGQGRSPSALVENQKNIIAATWKLLNRQNKMDPDKFKEEVNVVAASQQNLLQRTQMSLSRLVERFSFADESFDQAVIHMFEAVTHMQAASERLISSRLKEALGPEQAALQAILKAEAQSRRSAIQMARNRGGASGGDSQRREREDLRELFEMEMGRLENRYEMPAAAAGSAAAAQEDILNQLRRLARRQERLNRAQVDADRRKNRMTEAQQKRRLEELRREQEDLRRQADALAQQLSRTGRNRSAQGALNQAIDRMREAANNLERRNTGGAVANGNEALQRLRDQEQLLQQRHTASLSDLVKALDEKADRLQSQENQILKQMEGLSAQKSRSDNRGDISSDPGDREKVAALIAKKDRLQDELKETQETIWAIGSRGRQANPELARQAMEALRLLESAGIGRQVEETKAELKDGRLNLGKEKVIDRSIHRLASRLRQFNPPDPKSGPERIEQAATSAAALSQALENLQREVEALRSGQSQSAQSSGAPGRGGGQTADLNRLRDGLGRSRGHAQGLMQPWSQGEGWAADARSIYRELTRRQIEDFINQPDLWQSLLDPARELASRLSALAKANRLKDSPFSPTQPEPPDKYKSLVESYYKSLSEIAENRD